MSPSAIVKGQRPYFVTLKKCKFVRQMLIYSGIDVDRASWEALYDQVPAALTPEEKTQWIRQLERVALSSDAFFPFRDSIDRAHQVGE